MKKFLVYSILIIVSLIFVSCPDPLTEDMVTAAQDKLPPVIEVYSPGNNETYLSTVEFSVFVRDDAKNEDDGAGDIASISFAVSNDDFRGGLINIGSAGQVTQDPDGGPDSIDYDPDTGIIAFSVSTIEPNILNSLISVTITVTDRNNNVTEEQVSLFESEGPITDIKLVDEENNVNKYLAEKYITMSGTVSNSEDDPDSSSEITEIRWSLADNIVGQLVLDETATYVDSYNSSTLNYYNSSTGLYERRITGYNSDVYAGLFTFNPVTRAINAPIYINPNLEDKGSILMTFTILDQNGHEMEQTIFISENKIGPNPQVDVLSDGSYGHFSSVEEKGDIITGNLDKEEDELNSFKFKLTNGSLASTDYSSELDTLALGVTMSGT
ncbi:hypothetical protein, partial [Oceanispirochaeta sp.]|uniref:hypothetical protein n=1 Tax=Oceanispirochaeta sp. TaxID=2035350 RepID=UPI0026029EB8